MGSIGWFRTAVIVGAATIVVACSDGLPAPIIEGRWGGELRDEGCDWVLRPSVATTGVDVEVEKIGGGRSATIWPQGSDDALWVRASSPMCVDGPTVAFGGVDSTADEVVLVRSDGELLQLDLFDVDDRAWKAVFGEIPPRWMAEDRLAVEIVARSGGDEIAREGWQGWAG